MASIAEWIEKIKTAIYGEEVRRAIWQSLEAMNTEVEAINVDEEQVEQNKQDIGVLLSRLGTAQNLITDFDDASFFIGKFTTPNGVAVFPFATAAANQPASPATYGYCVVYYGGNSTTFMILYVNSKNKIYVRSYGSSRWYDWEKRPSQSEVDANTAAITALNSRLQNNNFYIKAMGQSGSANNTLKIAPVGADTLEHLIFAYGYGSGQKMFCFIMYARKSSNIISILNLSSALEGTASFDSDGNILIKLSNWMSGYIFSRHEVNVSYMSS